ncbi:hypothetical protein BJX99DRAFT_252933 [Aspergillus californicus]
MLPSSSSNSSQSSFDSPTSQYPPQQNAWFPSMPRRRVPVEIPKYPRFYSTPLNNEIPESTPLRIYGLEEREPSIAEKPRRFVRFSRALDDIKEDFTSQPHARNTADAIRARRQSTFSTFFDNNYSNPTLSSTLNSASGAGFSSASLNSVSSPGSISDRPPVPPIPSEPSVSRPFRRLSRRLSGLSFSQRKAKYRGGGASISQPNLIGSSNHI